jgi:enamine deaminase RidA (YjgF/YER057c/UK114 family)
VLRLGSGGPWEDAVGYSRVVRAGSLAWVAGSTAMIDGQLVAEGDAYGQAMAAFEIALSALARVGMNPTDVVRTRMYVVDANLAEDVCRAHVELFGKIRPVATLVVVKALIDPRMLVEVEVDAYSAQTAIDQPDA